MRRALPLDQAYAWIAGDDPRPLLVLRECLTCTGTDDALLTREADNEKTMLLARWFHCVKLPPDVKQPDHPFHALFEGEDPPHLFVGTRDGSLRRDLNGAQSRTELWKHLDEVLDLAYVEPYEDALKELQKLLNEFDEVDVRMGELNASLNARIEDDGPRSRKVKKLRDKLAKLEKELGELRARLREAGKLPLKEPAKGEHASVDGARTSSG